MLNTTSMTPGKVRSPLSRKATLVTVVESQWSGHKFDREITQETNARLKSKSDAGRWNKLVVPKEALAPVRSAFTAVGDLHRQMTSPWKDKGPRILANLNYSKYTAAMREAIRNAEDEADKFALIYPKLVAEAPERMKDAYNPEDYPPVSEIRSKFKIVLDFDTLPDEADFRCDLDPEIEADIRAEIEASSQRMETRMLDDTRERITEVVERMVKGLTEYGQEIKGAKRKRTFRDSLVDNVRELADLLPGFNLANDPTLAAITDRISKELCSEDGDELRKHKNARAAVQKSAESILDDVSKFLA